MCVYGDWKYFQSYLEKLKFFEVPWRIEKIFKILLTGLDLTIRIKENLILGGEYIFCREC